MEIQEIDVTIDKKGQVKLHVRGAKGKKCLDITRDLEKLLGGEVEKREMTPEALEDGAGNLIDQSLKVKP